jgi:amidohydrolase
MLDIQSEVKKVESDIVNWRHSLHTIPELGLELPETVQYISARLDEMGIPYKTLVQGNAIVALIEGGAPGRTLALRADMDGLPVREETGLPFASPNGRMHACGHDAHAAMLLGAAKILNAHRRDISGNIKLLFQPGEEYPGGAKPMIEEGAMDSPRVDAVMGLHAGQIFKSVPAGSIGVCGGNMMASMDRIYIKVIGKSAHGAYPELSVDPIIAATEIVGALQTIVSRETAAVEPVVVSVTRISGGVNQNIIPGEVELEGTVRTLNPETRSRIARRIEEIARGVCAVHQAGCEFLYDYRYPPLINDSGFTKFFVESAKKVLSPEKIIEISKPSMGGEDMAYFLEKAPGTFFCLSNPKAVDGHCYPHHHAKFDIDESLLWLGSTLLIQATVDWLNSNRTA